MTHLWLAVTLADVSPLSAACFVGLQGGSSRHKIHRTSEKTSFLSDSCSCAFISWRLRRTPHPSSCRVIGLKLLDSSGWDARVKNTIIAYGQSFLHLVDCLTICFSQVVVRLHPLCLCRLEDTWTDICTAYSGDGVDSPNHFIELQQFLINDQMSHLLPLISHLFKT